MVALSKYLFLLSSVFTLQAFAHPGHDVNNEIAQRKAYMAKAERRSLDHCAAKLKERGLEQRSIARRQQHVEHLRKKRSLETRDFRQALNTSHHSNKNYTSQTPADVLFAGNKSCILSPEVTEGPYYVSGELIRQDVTEKEAGVPLRFEVQVLNIHTCEPVTGVLLEMWHCNSTGVYGGIASGNSDGSNDARNLNKTAFRGIQQSKKDGVVTFDTIVPGHYMGRTPHIHVMAHFNATVLPNNTITGGTISHVGQLFFDQSLYDAVKATHPYNTNTQPVTTNEQDFIMAQEAENGDPVLEYTMLGSKLEDGLFGWIAFGVEPAANHTVMVAATYGKDGGHANPNPGFPGGPFPTGPMPSGGFPFPPGFSLPPGFSMPTNFPPFPGRSTNFPRPTVSGVPAPSGSVATTRSA